MNKKEATQILAIVRTAYPNVKIENPAGMMQSWMWTLGNYSADSVLKAAKLHISTCKWFPTPSEILDKIVRAELVYKDSEIDPMAKIESGEVKKLSGNNTVSVTIDEKLESLCRFVGLGYPNENED